MRLADKIIDKTLKTKKPTDRLNFLLKELFGLKAVKIFLATLAVLVIAPIIFFIYAQPHEQKNINYGINFSNKFATEMGLDWRSAFLAMLDDLHVKNVRLVAYWDDIEKTKGIYNFSDIEWQLQETDKRGINVIMTIGRKVPRFPECFEPQWWKNIKSEDERNNELYTYVQKAATTLGVHPSIKMWQVENEPFFPFGNCLPIKQTVVAHEVALVRDLDTTKKPILIQDSGEGGLWYPSYKMGDYLGISMYRKIWYDFWHVFFGRFVYFQYPLAYWSYKIKADMLQVPYQKIIVTELQAEPWGPGSNAILSQEEKDKTMSREDFIATIDYAQKAGFKDLYFWGAEWWLFEKLKNNNPYFWDTAKALFN